MSLPSNQSCLPTSSCEPKSSTKDEGLSELDIVKEDIESLFDGFKWPIRGFATYEDDGIPDPYTNEEDVIDIDGTTACSTGHLFDSLIPKYLGPYLEEKDIEVIESPTSVYPDLTIQGDRLPIDRVALDIKSTERTTKDSISRFHVGTFEKYFQRPEESHSSIKMPYADYNEHWILLFIYDENNSSSAGAEKRPIKNIEAVVHNKWEFSSRSRLSSTMKHIASITDLERIREGDGGFESRDDFLRFWRDNGMEDESQTRQTTL